VSGGGISWAICKSAPRSRQITTPASHHSFFTDRMPNQQRQSTEGKIMQKPARGRKRLYILGDLSKKNTSNTSKQNSRKQESMVEIALVFLNVWIFILHRLEWDISSCCTCYLLSLILCLGVFVVLSETHTHTHTHLMAFFPGLPR